jgi:predicted dehydrogenase
MATPTPIRVGLIGASVDAARSWGTRGHIPALRHLPDYRLTALCTSRQDTATVAARHFGVPHAFSDPRALAACPDVDLVVVSVRTPLHREMVAAALAERKHVYCEWPLGITTAEARETLEATRRAGVLAMIGMQGAHNEAIAHARDLIAQGYIGKMVSVTVKVTQENFGPVESPDNAYTADVRNGATLLRIASGQALEAICYCVGDLHEIAAVVSNQYPITSIAGSGELLPKSAPDQVLISGTLSHGAVISIHIRGGASPATAASRLEINGTEGDLLLTSPGPANIHRAPLLLQGARRGERELRSIAIPAKYELQPPGLPDGPARYLAHNYVAFASALRDDVPFANDFAHAVRWQERLDAIQRASDSGERQTLD